MTKNEWESQVKQHIANARMLERDNKINEAIDAYEAAYELIPEPKETSKLTMIVLCNIGEIHFLQGQWDLALEEYTDAVKCKEGLGNPKIHMRLGQLQYEIGNIERAKDELMRAYMGEGDTYFVDEDPKYFSIIQEFL